MEPIIYPGGDSENMATDDFIISKPQLPEYIYKYCKLDEYLIQLIGKRRLWFSSPADFNDPFDCKLYIDPNMDLTIDLQKGYSTETFLSQLQVVINKFGVCCFSENENNLLMWAHYANCHKGVCLKFETSELMKSHQHIRPIRYSEEFPKLDIFKNFTPSFLETPFHKSHWWGYEKEVRIMSNAGLQPFLPTALKQITFGVMCDRTSDQFTALLLELKSNDYQHINLAVATQDKSYYKIHYTDLS